ncbi:hypothetical protein BKA70DRAFT_396751 [Coprinopsis sp. MPI-PUGE-AT-0042]|nr:hypothetical protein BKA70DRAFT_396751 [Coprinopsis sp. MPI-PUGE-AT-0042]
MSSASEDAIKLSGDTAKAPSCSLPNAIRESTLSPVRQLPVELLTYVFILACDEQFINIFARSSGCVDVAAGSTAVTLTKVCRRWRSISTGVPDLWTRVELHCSGARVDAPADEYDLGKQEGTPSGLHPSSFLHSILNRSGARPLQLMASHPETLGPGSDGDVAPCMCSIMINETHFRVLSLDLQYYNLDKFLGSCTKFPCLRHMSLRACAAAENVHVASRQLTSFVLRNWRHWFLELTQLEVSWASLTALSLFWTYDLSEAGMLDLDDFFAALRQTVALSTLKFNLGDSAPLTSTTSLYLPGLRSLVIQDECQGLVDEKTLKLFTTPSLERFDYCTGYDFCCSIATSSRIDILTTWLSSLPNLQSVQIGCMEDSFFNAPRTGGVKDLDHAFYLVPPSPPSAFANLAERVFDSRSGSPLGKEVEGIRLLSDAAVQRLSPNAPFWPAGGDVDDVFETVTRNTTPVTHCTSLEKNFMRETGEDVKLYLQFLSDERYKGERSFLLHFPVPDEDMQEP